MIVHHRIKESVYSLTKNYTELLGPTWLTALSNLLKSEYMTNLQHYIDEVYKKSNFIYPRNSIDIFKPFKLTKAKDIRVVIFGDEPTPNAYSNGLAFGAYRSSNPASIELNSLKCSHNIKACLDPDDTKEFKDFDCTLLTWAEQQVLLLNISPISEYGNEMKHEYVFRNFIREIIKEIDNSSMEVVFVFTSKNQYKHFEKYIDRTFHTVLQYDKIDPDSSMFEDINRVLDENNVNRQPIEW